MLNIYRVYGSGDLSGSPNNYVLFTGSFAMTNMEEECVIAMKTDASNELLLTGDTAGFIAIFNIKNYCITDKVSVSQQLSRCEKTAI